MLTCSGSSLPKPRALSLTARIPFHISQFTLAMIPFTALSYFPCTATSSPWAPGPHRAARQRAASRWQRLPSAPQRAACSDPGSSPAPLLPAQKPVRFGSREPLRLSSHRLGLSTSPLSSGGFLEAGEFSNAGAWDEPAAACCRWHGRAVCRLG